MSAAPEASVPTPGDLDATADQAIAACGGDARDVGAVAISRTGDPATGDFGDAKVIRKFGEVPEDLSAL
jgi:hypothetical protein